MRLPTAGQLLSASQLTAASVIAMCSGTALTGATRLTAQQTAASPPAIDQGRLRLGQAQRRQLVPPASHAWKLELSAGDYAELEVRQDGVSVVVRIFTPTGRQVRVFDARKGVQGIERARWWADSSGTWTVALAPGAITPAGNYEIHLVKRRGAIAADAQLILADSLHRLGTQLAAKGQFKEAEAAVRRSLEIRQRELGSESIEVAETLVEVAVAAYRQARYAAADSIARIALSVREKLLGPDSPEVADVLMLMALGEQQRDRYATAEELHLRALKIRERVLGAQDPDVATSLNYLASVYVGQDRYIDAENAYRRALSILVSTFGPDDAIQVPATTANLARLYDRMGRYVDAETQYRSALAARERAFGSEDLDVSYFRYLLGWTISRLGRFTEAESLTLRSLPVYEKRFGPEHPFVAQVLQNLGVYYTDEGRYGDAEPLAKRAAEIEAKAQPDSRSLSAALNDLGVLYYYEARYQEAEALWRRTLLIRERTLGPSHSDVAESLNNIALLYTEEGRYADAEPLYRRALEIEEKVLGVQHPGYANDLNNLGLLYANQGRYREAEPVIRRALSIKEKTFGPSNPELVTTLNNLGHLLGMESRYAEAESLFRRGISILETKFGKGHFEPERQLSAIANLYLEQRRYTEAEVYSRRSLAAEEAMLGPMHPNVATSLRELSEILWTRDSMSTEAPILINRALAILEKTAHKPQERVHALAVRARIRKATGDRRRALEDLQEAIQSAEELRPQIGGDEEVRARYFDRYMRSYDLMVAWQLQVGAVDRALQYAERARARVLLDQLAAGKVDLRASIPLDIRAPLEARETEARARMAEYEQRVRRLVTRTDLADTVRQRLTATIQDSLHMAESEFSEVYAEIKNASPLWRDLITSGGEPVSLTAIQRSVLPRGSYLLLYQIGAERSYVFVVGGGNSRPVAVPLRLSREDARLLGVEPGALTSSGLDRILLGGSDSTVIGLSRLLGRQRVRGVERASATVSGERLHALWRILVPGHVWQEVKDASQVVVSPGRGLHLLPFEALVVDVNANGRPTYWLDAGPPIRYAASATTLYNLEHRASVRPVPSATHIAVLSLSDPIFDLRELAVPVPAPKQQATNERNGEVELTRGSFEALGGSLSRLPGTAAETDAIRAAFGKEAGNVVTLQREAATEGNLRPALLGKRYAHLATHGLVDEARGALFAALALTPPGNVSPDDDGFLQLHEIYQLHLPELELAVLSACETNVGTSVGGEGVFALSRGFLAAGGRRVIASEWAVEDKSTAELIGVFFQAIATAEEKGQTVDYVTALRDAKRRVRSQSQWANPYYWAPFVLTGAR